MKPLRVVPIEQASTISKECNFCTSEEIKEDDKVFVLEMKIGSGIHLQRLCERHLVELQNEIQEVLS